MKILPLGKVYCARLVVLLYVCLPARRETNMMSRGIMMSVIVEALHLPTSAHRRGPMNHDHNSCSLGVDGAFTAVAMLFLCC